MAGIFIAMNLMVRPAQPEDAAAIVAIFNPIIESGKYTVFDSPFTIGAEREYISSFPARGVFHVALRQTDSKIVGFQSMEPFATYTRAFDHVGVIGTYVDLAERGQGIAGHLFAATFEAARQKGYEKLFTFIRADNPAALAAYQRQGFQIIGTTGRQAKINGKYIDELMVEKFL